MDNNCVIRISDVVADLQALFDKMIECVEINIRKQLACQIADWNAGRTLGFP